MLWVPQQPSVRVITNGGIVGAASPGTGVPGNATTLLDGAVTELIAAGSNTQETWGVEVLVTATGLAATAAEAKLSILVGGATDDVLIPDLIAGFAVTGIGAHRYYFPLHIPGGLRVAAVLNSVRTSITSRVLIWLYGGGVPMHRVGSRVTVYGTEINGARGQAVVPAASGGTASVTEMAASTGRDHFAFLPGFQAATDLTVTPTGYVNIGIGVGAATEQRIGTWWYAKDTGENMSGPLPCRPVFADVPAGSRLTLLASNSGANDAAYDGHIYGVS